MSTAAALSPTLRSRIEQVAGRIRMMRLLRGLSLLVLSLAVLGGLALLADYVFELPALVRMGLATAWFGLGATLLIGGLVLPMRRKLDPAALAALIEEKYPELGERLTTSVELSENQDVFHGSPQLIALLLDETEKRTSPLPFLSAVPVRYAAVLTGAAAFALFLVAAPAAIAPKEYVHLTKRLFLSYLNVVEPVAYAIEVTPGDIITAEGKTVKVSVHLLPQRENAKLPSTSSVVLIDANGKETTRKMAVDNGNAFSTEWKVTANCRYRVETRDIASDTFTITSVVPVELAEESPKVAVTLPEYARATLETPDPSYGLVDLSALQHGTVDFEFRFTRPAVNAFIEWTPGEKTDRVKRATTRLPLNLSEDRSSASLTLPAKTSGTFALIMEAEHGIRTTMAAKSLVVVPDSPPEVLKFNGKEELRAILAYDTIPLDIEISDDVGVLHVDVEYRIKDRPAVIEEIPVILSRDVRAKHGFKLTGKVKEGDEVSYRIRIQDNLPKELNGPHTLYYPADRWLKLKIVKQADSLNVQEILAQKKEIEDRLRRIKEELAKEQRGIFKVDQESKNDKALKPEHASEVLQLRKDNRAVQKEMQDLVRDMEATPALRPLTERIDDVARTEVQQSKEALAKVDPKKNAPERTPHLQKADHEINEALKRLEELSKLNDRLAQDRIDQTKLEMLAEREKKLAEMAAELAMQDPVKDPTVKEQADNIKQEQADVAAELKQLTEESEKLRNALQEDAIDQAKKAAEKAKELAEAQRELNKAAEETERKANAERLADLAKKQQELADKAQKLADETKQPAQAAKTNPLKPEEAQQAADALKKGDPEDALKHQDKTAQDLDRLASALEKALDLAKDPREAARQLARLEEGLKKKVDEEAKKTDAKQPLADRLKPLQAEQKAIQHAAEQLSVPSQNQNAQKEKSDATKQAEQAAKSLEKQEAKDALPKMEETQKALERLADQLPSLDQRKQQAQQELDRLRQKQDEVARQSEQAIDQARQNKDAKKAKEELDKKLAEASRKQADIAEKLSKLDVPNQEARQEKAQEAQQRALADLMDQRKQDVPASQQDAKRELERLQQALNGQKPADEKATELAKQQRDLAAESAKAAADPKTTPEKSQELQRKQQQIAQDTKNLNAPEAPERKADAVEATRKAEETAKAKPTSPEAQKQMQDAAKKLDDLAKQLNGKESQAERAERLAKKQADAAAEAERLAKKQDKKPQDTEELKRKQQQIADEAKQLRAGEQAKEEKEKALQALHAAKDGSDEEKLKAQRDAAKALKNLADKLANEERQKNLAREQSPQQMAKELAKQQRELAKATQQAREEAGKQEGEAAKQTLEKALQKVGERQQDLNDKASQLPAQRNEKALEQAHEAMDQAKQALDRVDAGQAKAKQDEAADALEKLAQNLPREQTRLAQENNGQQKADLPTKEQSDKARDLAKEQRDLRDAVKRSQDAAAAQNTPQNNPVGELAKQQADVAKQAGDLAQQVGKEQGEKSPTGQQANQAKQNANQTAKQMNAGNLEKAQQSGKQTADQLRKLASDLAQTPRGKDADPASADPLRQARDLAKMQEDINRQLEPLTRDNAAQRAQQTAQRGNLRQQTADLKQNLEQLAKQMRSPQAQQLLQEAAGECKECEQGQTAAAGASKAGNLGSAQAAGNKAAQSLDKAAQKASQAADQQAAMQQQGSPGQGTPQDPKNGQQIGKAVNEAKGQMNKTQGQLDKGQNQGAQASMQKAADALAKAAEQMNQPGQPGQPGEPNGQPGQPGAANKPDKGVQPGGVVDATLFGPDMQKFVGKPWGELPGELRTRIVQDMKAKYGDDYAKMIKLYFEQIADTKKKN